MHHGVAEDRQGRAVVAAERAMASEPFMPARVATTERDRTQVSGWRRPLRKRGSETVAGSSARDNGSDQERLLRLSPKETCPSRTHPPSPTRKPPCVPP